MVQTESTKYEKRMLKIWEKLEALLDQWSEKQGTLTYKPYVAGRVEGYKTREDMKNAENHKM